MKEKAVVIGAGSWGTALAVLLAQKGMNVFLWARRKDVVQGIKERRENERYLPGIILPGNLMVTLDLEEALRGAGMVVLGVPSHGVRETVRTLQPFLTEEMILVNTAKGIENDSLLRLSQVITEELPTSFHERIAVLSGPSHAEEVAKNIPTTVVVAAKRRQVAEFVQDLFMTPRFRVYTNPDVIGVELGGALKNIVALCAGISDGLGFGDNTKAALITRGLAEIARLGVAMGANALTFSGLSGIGDLVVTCTSMHSRNRRAGILLGQGRNLDDALATVGMVVEGVRTTRAAYDLARKYRIEMPITAQAYKVLFEGKTARAAVGELMERGKTHEVEEVVLGGNW